MESFKNEISNSNAAIFTIQESHFNKKGKLKLENFEVFEAMRKKQKGGTIIGAHKGLNPVLIEEYSDDFELLVVEVKIRNKEIRILSGYGPQETWQEADRMPFFVALEQEITKAEMDGKAIIIEMNSNSKLGPEIIPKDPHIQSANGKVLAGIVDRHGLIVANGLNDKCVGSITRRRETVESVEESIIDHVIISEDLLDELESINIDEERNHTLMKIVKTKKGVVKKASDHNVIVSKFNLKWSRKNKAERIELYNLKNRECQKNFKLLTSNSNILSSSFNNTDDINTCTNRFIKNLNKCIKQCFKKVRITDRPNKEIQEFFDKRRTLRNRKDDNSREELVKVEEMLANLCAKSNYEKIKEEINNIKCDEGGVNSGNLWKLKKKLNPRCRDPPTAMCDVYGNLVTSDTAIRSLAVETYRKRLENRKMKDDLKHIQEDKEELCKLRIKLAKKNKTPPWTMAQLETVLNYLKKNKSRDPLGYANELFHDEVAGDDLKVAILEMLNRVKAEQVYPEALEVYDISSIYKNKGRRNCFESYRGIFRVPIFRGILDRLIYNDEYSVIDSRQNRNIRDNIFVLNAITNSVINGNEDPVDVQVFDIEKCFDALWVEECINDIYEAGLDNDKLGLLFLENQNANIAVKTPTGKSARVNIQNIIMQGTVWGSLLCTATMDKLGQLAYKNNEFTYKYKGVVETPSLGMVDDVLSVQKCSGDALKANAVINAFVESKKLKLSAKKCHKIHVSKKKDKECRSSELKVHNEKMHESKEEKYLGDYITSSGKNDTTIEDRKNKGYGIVAEILAILDDIPLGKYKMEIGLMLRQAMLLNGILYNSEAWHSLSEKEVKMLEAVDEHLLRSLVKGHSKVPLEFLFLETGAIPIRFLVSSRRMNFLQTILKREDGELTKRIYKAQADNPTSGDFVELVKEDFKMIDVEYDEGKITNMSREAYKHLIKGKIKMAALNYLRKLQDKHSKIRDISYKELKVQGYMISPIFSDKEVNTLHSLRSRSVDCKANLKNMYKDDDMLCKLCKAGYCDQKHILECGDLINTLESEEITRNKIVYEDIFNNDVNKQKEVTALFCALIQIRKKKLQDLLKEQSPSTSDEELRRSDILQPCIVYSSLGNK